jgi:predicted amidohydrolase
MEVKAGEDNSENALRLLQKVASLFPWVDIVLFSELSICGLNADLAAPIPNTMTAKLCEWSRTERKWLIPGSIYEKDQGKIYNTAIVISPEGKIVKKYRKLFPWRPLEKSEPGDSFCVFDIPEKGRVGLCICYDEWFPEIIRTLAWSGAEVILHPTATYTSDRSLELIISQSHAIINQVFFLSVAGVGGGGIGKSIFVDPEGRVLQVGSERESILTEIIDLDQVKRVQEYGTLGLSQLWKDLANFRGVFPVYQRNIGDGEVFRTLGQLKLHRKING